MSARLEAGGIYRAIGPADTSKLGPAQEVEILKVDEQARCYRTKGSRQVAAVIAFGAEHLWRRVHPETLTPAPSESLIRPWWEQRLVAFDLETTSAEPEEARIVTAAIAICGGGEPTKTMTWLVDPGIEIPEEAAGIHGITTEHAREHGDQAGPAIAEILTALSDMTPDGAPLVIFNARYDLTVLDREARRHGLNPLGTRRRYRVIDPLVIDKHLHRYRKGSRKLDAQAAHNGARLDDAHDATADALAAARVAWCIGRRGEVIRRVRHGGDALELRRLRDDWELVRQDLDLLHAAQTEWAAAQAASLEDYFRKQGTLEKPVEREWPVVPYRAPGVEAAAA